MAASLITSFIGTALNLGQAAKQQRLIEQAQRQADIDTEKAFRAIESSKVLDLELPMKEYRRQEQLIAQQTRQAVEAAQEAGPRGVASIPAIQAAGVQAYEGLTAMKEKALIGLQNLEEEQRVKGELAEAKLRAESAAGAQEAVAEAREAKATLISKGIEGLTGTIEELTKFDEDEKLYNGGDDMFGGVGEKAEGFRFIPTTARGLAKAQRKANRKPFGETQVGSFLGSIPDFLGGLFKGK